MNKEINLRYRYDFFTIWGNGLSHAEAILDILRNEENIEIIRIESRQIKNMKKFVFDLYACDPVPIGHLRAKLKYLFREQSKIIIVFVKNFAPEENYFGEGLFRHIQCNYIKSIKEKIRDIYNPRINGIRTEEHVIHASDYEEQVDYFLKMLGHSKGIGFIHGDGSVLPFRKPYHIPRPKLYTFKTLAIKDLRASILVDVKKRNVKTQLMEIHQTPHFCSLQGEKTAYADYLERFRHILLTDNHSLDRLIQMNQWDDSQIMAFDPILVREIDDGFQIMDGVHRAAIAFNHKHKYIRCTVI